MSIGTEDASKEKKERKRRVYATFLFVFS